MKAIRRASRPLQIAVASTLLTLLAACAAPHVAPPPRPAVALPQIKPAPAPRPAIVHWRDAPATPGTWSWGMVDGRSTSRFTAPDGRRLLTLVCDRQQRALALTVLLPPAHSQPVRSPVSITTTAMTRIVDATGTPDGLRTTFAAHDALLDAMAFSRGRFALEVPGEAALYPPNWPEVSRVIEDCR